jgi:acetyl-CoA carboxylase biotin carboxyl carrier protein
MATKKSIVDGALIRELADLLKETGLSEIEIGEGERRVRVARGAPTNHDTSVEPAASSPSVTAPALASHPVADGHHPGAVTSPMVGTVYVAPEPGADPFVKLGDSVKEGQTLLIVEAMKVMNPIRAPRTGRVSQILISDGAPVEYGEALIILE